MPIHKIKLLAREEIALGTKLFTFEKPTDFHYQPGQYGGFTLIEPKEKDDRGATRRFSFSSCPSEPVLAFATRMLDSAYKKSLNQLQIGHEIKLAGPTGNFVLHDDINTPAVFIAGGIGVTPFYSMIKHAKDHPNVQSLTLFFGNQNETCAPFFNELLSLKEQTHLKLINTLAEPEHGWQGETGFITHSMIKKYVPDIYAPIYYVCGSPAMVTTMQELLIEMGIDEAHIKVEDFPGY